MWAWWGIESLTVWSPVQFCLLVCLFVKLKTKQCFKNDNFGEIVWKNKQILDFFSFSKKPKLQCILKHNMGILFQEKLLNMPRDFHWLSYFLKLVND